MSTCEFYAEIGAGVCDDCGKPAKSHRGVKLFKKGASPFGDDRDCWEYLTWVEWEGRLARDKEVAAARKKIADLSDEEAVRLAWLLAGPVAPDGFYTGAAPREET
jgi:hypothetical protein